MFATATYSSGSEGGVNFHFSFVPIFTLVPILLGLWESSSWKEWNFSYMPFTLGCIACLAIVFFVSSRMTRDVFGLRRGHRDGLSGGGDGGGGRPRQSSNDQTKRGEKRFDAVAEALQKMETGVYENREALEALSVSELKARNPQSNPPRRSLRRRQQLIKEKSELIDEILQKNGTSNQMCVICYSDYENGDIQRKLPCGHRFHIECVDQWILQKSRCKPPVCPMCNQPVVEGLQ